LTGAKKGQVEDFVILPGQGDNIRLTDRNTLLAPMALPRTNILLSPLDVLGKWPSVRNLFYKVHAYSILRRLVLKILLF
jgi:hypothetical protein